MQEELLALERRFWEDGGHGGFYRERFADDGLTVFGFGTLDKEHTIDAIPSASPWENIELGEATVTQISDDVAAVTYAASASRAHDDRYDAVVSSVYVRRDGTWQLILHQQSPPM